MTDLTKRAADMLLHGATLVSQPCPYCHGVRVMKNGNALCTNCGREPSKQKPIPKESSLVRLEKKLDELVTELETAKPDQRKAILESIDMLAQTISKLRK